jgi:hypothetical protein
MKKLILTLIILVTLSGVYFYLIILGGPVRKTLTINSCKEEYTYYITDNRYQVEKTHGHATDNSIELGAAKIEVAKCLCNSYLNNHSQNDSIEIIKILTSGEYYQSKNIFENILQDFRIDTITVDSICKNKDKYLQRMMLD